MAFEEPYYTPWGDRRTPAALAGTTREYTGQQRDDTGLLFYNARYYDPVLARFVSPDTIVPGTSAGSGGAAATVGSGATSSLTVDFHEGGFLSQLNGVNGQRMGQGFWFELSGEQRQQAEGPSGPANPQALNRYSYVLNNPLRYTDPTGHCVCDWRTIWRSIKTIGQWLAHQISAAKFELGIGFIKISTDPNKLHHIFGQSKHNWDATGLSEQDNHRLVELVANGKDNIVRTMAVKGGTISWHEAMFNGMKVVVKVFKNAVTGAEVIEDGWVVLPK